MADFHAESSFSKGVFGKASTKTGKSDAETASAGVSPPQPQCPQCANPKVWKDGQRETDLGFVQRWLCRNCGFRFSDPRELQVQVNVRSKIPKNLKSITKLHNPVVVSGNPTCKEEPNGFPFSTSKDIRSHDASMTTVGKSLIGFADYNRDRQICVKETKNLAAVESRHNEVPTREETTTNADAKGLITQFMAWCEAEGYPKVNKYHWNLRRLVKLGANLLDPQSVKKTIGGLIHKDGSPLKNGSKMLYTYAYDAFTKMLNIHWDMPTYKQEEALPFVPEEKELDQLIAACRSKRMAAFLQCLKETYADPGEALGLRWIDIKGNAVTINAPVKGHYPGDLPVSNRLLAMFDVLPKTSERIFPTTYRNMLDCYKQVRKRVAEVQQNPRFLAIEFRSFRHWGGSMLSFFSHGNVPFVQRKLRHKSVVNTMKYIHMVHFKDDDFDVTTATTLEEIKQAAEAGFEKYDEINGIHVYRRPKRFR